MKLRGNLTLQKRLSHCLQHLRSLSHHNMNQKLKIGQFSLLKIQHRIDILDRKNHLLLEIGFFLQRNNEHKQYSQYKN